MKWRLTTHALDRWCERVEPEAPRADASARLVDLLARARHVGGSEGGSQIYRLPHPSDPHVVVLRKHGVHLVVTVLDDAQWNNRQDYRRDGKATPRRRMK